MDAAYAIMHTVWGLLWKYTYFAAIKVRHFLSSDKLYRENLKKICRIVFIL